jgi:hypothetical protein
MPRRATDRVEDAVAWMLVAAGLLLVVLIGSVAGAVYSDGLDRVAAEHADRHQVPAELLTAAEQPGRSLGRIGRVESRPASWVGPQGQPRTGQVPVPPTAARDAEGRVLIWVDDAGRATRPPVTPAQTGQAAVLVAIAMAAAGTVALGGIWLAVRALVDRLNAARWEREWARVGPRWSRRVH